MNPIHRRGVLAGEEVRPRQGYAPVGRHGAVEVCRWTRSAILGGRMCYKRWFGVSSHRCVQVAPNADICNFSCPFCWRTHSVAARGPVEWDGPADLVEGAIAAQRRLLMGFKGNASADPARVLEAMFPRHMAISLDGEPTLYPQLPALIEEVRRHGMTAFLVTNGSVPYRLRELLRSTVPHNIYISVYGPDAATYEAAARPSFRGAWEAVRESISLLRGFEERGSRTVFRMTLVKGLNMADAAGYASLVDSSGPMFVELKGYSWIGGSNRRLPITAMPTFDELREFASRSSRRTGYSQVEADWRSRVILMARDGEVVARNAEEDERLRRRIEELDEPWRRIYLEGGADFRPTREGVPPWPGGWI